MQRLMIASAIALAANLVQAEPFAFEKQLGNPELDPTLGAPKIDFPPVTPSRFTPSIDVLAHGNPDLDMDAGIRFTGTIVPSGPTRISLYEVYRRNPDGVAYRDYYEAYPADTDWEAIARDHRRKQQEEFASKARAEEAGS